MYLDMNGIIHPCCHPEDGPAPEDEEHMYENIFLYLDRLIRIVRPKKDSLHGHRWCGTARQDEPATRTPIS